MSAREKPILMSAPMVRALLAGTKTQTRRALRDGTWLDPKAGVIRMCSVALGVTGFQTVPCPYGQPGDRLWVREAWARTRIAQDHTGAEIVVYREGDSRTDYGGPWKPGIHMFRRDSRITLEITEVRVERLQDISQADANAEGVAGHPDGPWHAYRALWLLINGPGSWDANPWVWAVAFRKRPNGPR